MKQRGERKKEHTLCDPAQDPQTFPAAALAALLDLLDHDRCRDWLFEKLRPGLSGRCCPGCGSELTERRARTFRAFRKTCCQACGLQFRATTGTVFFHVRFSPAEIVLAGALIAAGANIAGLAAGLKRGTDTAKIWQDRLEGLALAALRTPIQTTSRGPQKTEEAGAS